MRIWEYSLQQITAKLDCDQFRFLTNTPAEPYVAILVALYRARQEEMQLEMPLVLLYERVLPILQQFKSAGDYDRTGWIGKDIIAIDLGAFLVNLANHRNRTVWNLWMRHPVPQSAFRKLGFKKR